MKRINKVLPFNFEYFLENQDTSIVTKYGNKVEVIKLVKQKDGETNLLVCIKHKNGFGSTAFYNTDGICVSFPGDSNLYFLIEDYILEPYDKIIVANPGGKFHYSLFSHYTEEGKSVDITGKSFTDCYIIDENSIHLIGKVNNHEVTTI